MKAVNIVVCSEMQMVEFRIKTIANKCSVQEYIPQIP